MLYRKLGKTGWKVSVLSLGGSSIGGAFGSVSEKAGIRVVRSALDLGINFFQTAPYYGFAKSELVLGKALKGVLRGSYYISSCVGRSGPEHKDFDFSHAAVTRSVDESLKRLGLAHLDLVQIQDIEYAPLSVLVEETLPALRKLRQQGKVHKIGVSGFPLKALRNFVSQADVDVVLSYGHYTLNDITLVQMFPSLLAKNVGVINAAPLGMGLLTLKGPPKWHPAPASIRDRCAEAVAKCAKKKANLTRLVIQFACSNKDIATTLVGVGDPRKMKENVKWIGESMDLQLLTDVEEILRPIQNKAWSSGRSENN